MIISEGNRSDTESRQLTYHPLDPLTAEEIVEATRILTSERNLGPRVRFETIVLKEPDKAEVLGYQPGNACREARVHCGVGQ